jgi:hypothetical protein
MDYSFLNSSGHPARELEFDKEIRKCFLEFGTKITEFFPHLNKVIQESIH